MNYENTSLWKSTLGKQGDKNVENLRVSYNKFREHIECLLKEVGKDFPNLTDHELLYLPIMISGFPTFNLKDGVPKNNCGFIDCLYRKAELMGYKICFSFVNDYVRINLGMMDRAMVMEVKR